MRSVSRTHGCACTFDAKPKTEPPIYSRSPCFPTVFLNFPSRSSPRVRNARERDNGEAWLSSYSGMRVPVVSDSLKLPARSVESIHITDVVRSLRASQFGEGYSSALKYPTGCDIAGRRWQNRDGGRGFVSRAKLGFALGEVEKCRDGISQQNDRGGMTVRFVARLTIAIATLLGSAILCWGQIPRTSVSGPTPVASAPSKRSRLR